MRLRVTCRESSSAWLVMGCIIVWVVRLGRGEKGSERVSSCATKWIRLLVDPAWGVVQTVFAFLSWCSDCVNLDGEKGRGGIAELACWHVRRDKLIGRDPHIWWLEHCEYWSCTGLSGMVGVDSTQVCNAKIKKH